MNKIKYIYYLPILLLILISCNAKTPVISFIDPKIGRMGEIITLTGSNFGEMRDGSYVTIAGIAPTSSSYFLWQDDSIMVRVPELGDSGLVYVHVKGKKSNGLLFSNIASVPRSIEGTGLGSEPNIISVNPQTGAPGTLITITGINFGASRDPVNAGIFFSWDYTASFNPFVVREPEFVEVSENELGYESWSSREIIVRVPDGAVSGSLEARTPNGKSRPVFFDISGRPGNKNFSGKRSYTVSYSVDIRVLEASQPNSLYLWVPIPASSPSQRNITLVSRNANPFIERYRGLNLYKLDNLATGMNHSIKISYQVEVYSVETVIRPMSVGKIDTPLSAHYTQSSNLIPSTNSLVLSTAETIMGREQNPYLKARMIYDWIINNINISESMPHGNAVSAINQKRADSYSSALLYTSLMRASGIPCVPVAGVLIDRNGQTIRHYWTEFWIDGFGWVPVDPALGSGAAPATFPVKEDHVNYYFGNLDNQRIAFSWGEQILTRMDRQGRLVSRNQTYSLQNIWEEAAGGLESYTSLWGDITISGVYAH
ncbi:MAG: IPT/TIG domain-containing protein [Treponema sp.]|jgi:transglutaminase-like putative cysteine protease|nr:IPT/TIG domain-containing protein [Treponema sp.]